ncbi:hypothetical protein [Streptomyces sp. NPDC003832]
MEALRLDRPQPDDNDPVRLRYIEAADQLITVLRYCVDKGVVLVFG